ncbi:unnamed protein product, partial [Iphiclides podalirius]
MVIGQLWGVATQTGASLSRTAQRPVKSILFYFCAGGRRSLRPFSTYAFNYRRPASEQVTDYGGRVELLVIARRRKRSSALEAIARRLALIKTDVSFIASDSVSSGV